MMGEGGEAPIFAHPRFETIEAEGLHGEVAATLDALAGGVGACGSATEAAIAR